MINTDSGVTREITSAFQEWETVDLALICLLIATLSDEAIEHMLGCKITSEAWLILEDRYATVSKSRINMLKTEFQTLQKGSDNIDKFLSRLKSVRDQLIAAGEHISKNDLIIAALAGLPKEYATIRTVILARKNTISLKEFRAQLLNTGLLHLILNLMLMYHLQLLVLLLRDHIILQLFHRSIRFHIMRHLHHTLFHLHHFHITLMFLYMVLVILVPLILLDLHYRILCLLNSLLFNKDLTMVVLRGTMVVTNTTKTEVIMEDISKEDGLVTLILGLTCNLSVIFVNEGVT